MKTSRFLAAGAAHDVAAAHPDIVRRLAGVLSERLRAADACMPVVRGTGQPVPMPDEVLY